MSKWTASQRLTWETAIIAAKLAQLLARTLSTSAAAAEAQSFLTHFHQSIHGVVSPESFDENPLTRFPAEENHPVSRLANLFGWDALYTNLVLLAGLAEEHEGFAAVFRTLHPRGDSRPSAGLAAHLFCNDAQARLYLRSQLESGSAETRGGAVRLVGDAPFHDRSLQLVDGLWPVLHDLNVWPAGLQLIEAEPVPHGLDEWFQSPAALQALAGLRTNRALTILVPAETESVGFHRAIALAAHAGLRPVGFAISSMDSETERLIELHSGARGLCPVLKLLTQDAPGGSRIPRFRNYPAPVFVTLRAGTASYEGSRPMISVPVERLSPPARLRMWREILPSLADDAPTLAAQFPIEPALAADAASDLEFLAAAENREIVFNDVSEALRSRANQLLTGGIQLIRPTATWASLVLSREREKQLREAVNRLRQQGRVLDEWGFLRGRPGARGVRMLFSGPPGTGKTLSAEVIAAELNVDLLLVDISRVVSKWIGETEKNLAAVFDTAEKARAVLFFDEADALFGKRTEVSDAHDRYANLETAYLLARLERFDGLAILATNLRSNIDPALMRRMEFSLDFAEPDKHERAGIWRAHVPDTAPTEDDVDFDELAALFPIVGGLIRNASVAAAFLAASEGSRISRRHLMTAIRREYEKASRAFPAALKASL